MKHLPFCVALFFVAPISHSLYAGECESKLSSKYSEINLTGTVARVEREQIDKHGDIKTTKTFRLVSADFTTELPVKRNCQGIAEVDPEPFVGETVTVVAKGLKKRSSSGKPVVYVHQLVRLKKGVGTDTASLFSPSFKDIREDIKPPKANSRFRSLTLEGRLIRREFEKLDAAGNIQNVTEYALASEGTEITLPTSSTSRWDSLVGQAVRVAAQGLQRVSRGGNRLTFVDQVEKMSVAETKNPRDPFSADRI